MSEDRWPGRRGGCCCPRDLPACAESCQLSSDSVDIRQGLHEDLGQDTEEGPRDSASDTGDLSGESRTDGSASGEEDSLGEAVLHEEIHLGTLHEGSDSDYNELAEWPWLQAVDVVSEVNGQKIGSSNGKIINREPIRATFYRDIEEPTSDTSEMGFGLFDRWGNLKNEYIQHDVKKGTGVWGKELNEGNILLIEQVNVRMDHRRQAYGKNLVAAIWAKAQEVDPLCEFAVTRPAWLWSSIRNHHDGLPEEARPNFLQEIQLSADSFWRACGFRRIGTSFFFGLAKDPEHPSRRLASSSDHRRRRVLQSLKMSKGQKFPYDEAMVAGDDANVLASLKARLKAQPLHELSWLTVDKAGGNLMHMVAETGKPESLRWLLGLPFADQLQQQLNLEGETPLESTRAALEERRLKTEINMLTIPRSDDFEGYPPNYVACMAMLRIMTAPSDLELLRLTYGCTCGQCIAGFLSPRLAHALVCQSEIGEDMLRDELGMTPSGDDWVEENDYYLENVDIAVKQNMRTNKSLRQGFAGLVGCVAKVLEAKEVPTTARFIAISEGEWPPHTRKFLQRGGTPISAVLACFDAAMNQDQYLGDGEHQRVFGDEIEELPECRNDGEFVFARRRLGVLEGLRADDVIREGMMAR